MFRVGKHVGAGNRLEGGFGKSLLGPRLIAERRHTGAVRTDEGDAVFAAGFGKLGVFRQKAVAGVDGLRARDKGGTEDPAFVQIAVLCSGGADADAFVGQRRVQAVPVRFGADRHACNAHFLAGTDDTHGDLAAVCNENFRKHAYCSTSAKENSALMQSVSPT